MSDSISRKAAINAIPQTSVDIFENCRNCKLLDRAQVVTILESLPSAEPKTGKNTNANEIYNYLKDRIGDIVDDMKEFDAWFERMVWHVKECDRLTAESKRVKGRWIEMLSYMNHTYKCSECGRLLVNVTDGKNNVSEHYPYCHCGADMRGEQGE